MIICQLFLGMVFALIIVRLSRYRRCGNTTSSGLYLSTMMWAMVYVPLKIIVVATGGPESNMKNGEYRET